MMVLFIAFKYLTFSVHY